MDANSHLAPIQGVALKQMIQNIQQDSLKSISLVPRIPLNEPEITSTRLEEGVHHQVGIAKAASRGCFAAGIKSLYVFR